ncbi:MAG: universal stress protein [Acidimicrobiales bacterium]
MDSEASVSSVESPSRSTGSVVVGIDGSPGAMNALRWATDKTAILGQVTPVIAFQVPATLDVLGGPRVGDDPALYRSSAEATMAKALDGQEPGLSERAVVVERHSGIGLVEAAGGADLLVVGTRGRGAVSAALLGSVGSYCVKHAAVPVAVVPTDWATDTPLGTIVVGVDGSENAEAALRWAVDHCGEETRIVAVGAFSILAYAEAGVDPPLQQLEQAVREQVEKTVASVVGPANDGPPIEVRVDPHDPRIALPRIAEEEGDLLVIGARGVSGIAHLILGSVAGALTHHPTVPTVIVPAATDRPTP